MRTTVEIPDPRYRRLRAAAADRGMRGFSPLVEEAIEGYFERDRGAEGVSRRLEAAAGSWSEEDVAEWERARERAWKSWRSDPSSTPTS